MSWLAIVLASLLLLPGFAIAQISPPQPPLCIPMWQGMFNSLNQSACIVAAYLMAACNGGLYSVQPLQPGVSNFYAGPGRAQNDSECSCSTITYSLFSACAACQQGNTITWSEYASNCTTTSVSSFPKPVPEGTRVPQWALLNVTHENKWNNITSYKVGDAPEIYPGTLINVSTSVAPTPTPPSATPYVGAIAGAVAGGVAAIALTGLAIFWLQRKRPQTPSAVFGIDDTHQPLTDEVRPSDGVTYVTPFTPGAPPIPMILYDPNDPTTFPWFQGADEVYTEVPLAPPAYSGGILADMQTSPPREYHGLPIV